MTYNWKLVGEDMAKKQTAKKFDAEKPRTDLLPTEALIEVAKVLGAGAKKYDEHNWRNGFRWSRLYGAALRHLFAWNQNEDFDQETGLLHLAHATCCCLFLLTHQLLGLGEDDRWKDDD